MLAEQRANTKPSLNRKVDFVIKFRKANSFFSNNVFQVCVWVWFQQVSFRVLVFCSTNFFSSAKFQVGFVESLKLASRFLVCVSVNFSFDWSCRLLLAKFTVGFVGSGTAPCGQNRLAFFSAKVLANWVCKIVLASLAFLFYSKVRFSKIVVLVRLWFYSVKPVFVASVLVGCRFWLFSVLVSPVFSHCQKIKLRATATTHRALCERKPLSKFFFKVWGSSIHLVKIELLPWGGARWNDQVPFP